MANELYTTNQEVNLYSTGAAFSGKELDLRQEIYNTLFGADDEIAKGRTGLIRVMRRDDDGELTRCPCRDQVTDEPDLDYFCKFCMGHGWLWDEVEMVYYKNDDAYRRWGYTIFYVRYSDEPTDDDFIVELKRDTEGELVVPITREKLFKIEEASDFRADDGRIEFWRIKAVWDKKWSVWPNRYVDSSVQIRDPGAGA